MLANTLHYPTLSAEIWAASRRGLLRNMVLAFAGTLLLTLSAKVQMPFWPVPMTMQTLVVLLIGTAYGWKLGGATILLYLAEGVMGLPVFAGTPEKGIGLAYVLGPTGGYLIGFVLAAVATGWLAERGWDRSRWRTAGAMTIGMALIYICGLTWLGSLIGWDKPVFRMGLLPFIPGDILKIAIAILLLPALWKRVGRGR